MHGVFSRYHEPNYGLDQHSTAVRVELDLAQALALSGTLRRLRPAGQVDAAGDDATACVLAGLVELSRRPDRHLLLQPVEAVLWLTALREAASRIWGLVAGPSTALSWDEPAALHGAAAFAVDGARATPAREFLFVHSLIADLKPLIGARV